MSNKQATYSEIADVLDALPVIIREARRARGLSLRDAADQIGCSYASLHRFENNIRHVSRSAIPPILRWLDQASTP